MQLLRLIKTIDNNYNVIIVDGHRYGLLISILYSKFKKIPLILRLRGNIWREINVNKANIENIFDKIIVKFVDKLINNVLIIISVSHFLKKEIICFTKYDPKNILVIYPSVDPYKFKPNNKKEINKLNTLITVTNFNYIKKIEPLIGFRKIFNKLIHKYNIKIYILGGGKYLDYIKKIYERDKINVIFTGHVNNVKDYLAKANIFFHLSKLDTFGVSIVEAQLMELPVVALSYGGVPEIISDGLTGFLINNKIDFEKKIIYLITNPKSRNIMGKQGRNRCLELFSPEKTSKQYYDIINKITGWDI
jgi:glycosyltransferase involved in cell wall biosynthesis